LLASVPNVHIFQWIQQTAVLSKWEIIFGGHLNLMLVRILHPWILRPSEEFSYKTNKSYNYFHITG
jgi:hypothetical protein